MRGRKPVLFRKLLSILTIIMILLPFTVYAEGTSSGSIISLPIDFSAGFKPQADGFSENGYSDPSITVSIEEGRRYNCAYWAADIKIADPSQLRTMSAGGFSSSASMDGEAMARRANAVLAINGDYYSYTGMGLILRQGTEYLNILDGKRDILAVDRQGDFHVHPKATTESIANVKDQYVNVFYFGPVLVEDGKAKHIMSDYTMASEEGRQRMAIGQVGPLEYKAVCCAGPMYGSSGMTLQEFANLNAFLGVQTAYNLDGGDSTMLMLNARKKNNLQSTTTRKLMDIIYFASAYEPHEE